MTFLLLFTAPQFYDILTYAHTSHTGAGGSGGGRKGSKRGAVLVYLFEILAECDSHH